jgi:hypothetical protein
VRGLNERDKRLGVRNPFREWKGDLLCLKETELELVSMAIVRSL